MKTVTHQLQRLLFTFVLVSVCFGSAQNLFDLIQTGDTAGFSAALQSGADINATDQYGQTPLMYAVTYDQYRMVIDLIQAGVNVNARTLAGWTALHYAARDRPATALVIALLVGEADRSARNQDFDTPYDVAVAVDSGARVYNHMFIIDDSDATYPGAAAENPAGTSVGDQIAGQGPQATSQPDSLTQGQEPSMTTHRGTAIVAGENSSFALLHDGTLRAWGRNLYGGLGIGHDIDKPALTPVPGLANVEAIATGSHHSLALLIDGTVMAWGNNDYGELGDGSTVHRTSPTPVPGLTNVRAIAAGAWHSLALLQDGTVMAWGNNDYGQLGDGSRTDRSTPTPVPGLTNVEAIAAGAWHTLALLSDGTISAWGNNGDGQLGDGSRTDRSTPTPVPGLTNVMTIAAGVSHSLALLHAGTVMAWGSTEYGQLGDGTVPLGHNPLARGRTTHRSTPTRVQGLNNVEAIATKWDYSLALLNDGTVMAWGHNNHGQLGDGSRTDRSTPTPVPGLTNVEAIATGVHHSLALLQGGTVRAWGRNDYGQLGDGTTTGSRTPTTTMTFLEADSRAVSEREMAEREYEAAEQGRQAALAAEEERRAREERAEVERRALVEPFARTVGENPSDMAWANNGYPKPVGTYSGWATALYTTNQSMIGVRLYVANVQDGQFCKWTFDIPTSFYVYPGQPGYQGANMPSDTWLPAFAYSPNMGSTRPNVVWHIANPNTGRCERIVE